MLVQNLLQEKSRQYELFSVVVPDPEIFIPVRIVPSGIKKASTEQ